MTAMKQIGESKGLLRTLGTGAATLALLLASGYAMASNVLQDVRYAAAPGGKVDCERSLASGRHGRDDETMLAGIVADGSDFAPDACLFQ